MVYGRLLITNVSCPLLSLFTLVGWVWLIVKIKKVPFHTLKTFKTSFLVSIGLTGVYEFWPVEMLTSPHPQVSVICVNHGLGTCTSLCLCRDLLGNIRTTNREFRMTYSSCSVTMNNENKKWHILSYFVWQETQQIYSGFTAFFPHLYAFFTVTRWHFWQ